MGGDVGPGESAKAPNDEENPPAAGRVFRFMLYTFFRFFAVPVF
jgi:hypothetical protein